MHSSILHCSPPVGSLPVESESPLVVPLLAVGVALLVVGLKRRKGSRTAAAPALAPGFVGLGLQRSF